VPKCLALYAFDYVKDTSKANSDQEVEQKIASIVTLISCLEEKDRFVQNFNQMLSKRLLNNDLASIGFMHWEKYLVKTIKSTLGSEFSKPLDTLIKEIDLSHSTKAEFVEYIQKSGGSLSCELSVNIIAKCDWLSTGDLKLKPTLELLSLQKYFEGFYLSRSQNVSKDLEWLYNFGKMEIKANIGGETYFISCMPYQYMVLSIIESKGPMTIEDLALSMGMSDLQALSAILATLTTPKRPLLSSPSPLISLFPVLPFPSRSRRVALGGASFLSASVASDPVIEERRHTVQSMIVRLMKASKTLSLQVLVEEVEKMLHRFKPQKRV